ncbi:DUF898 domain-containing protein [Trinickia terrae]|uniref:DUF898 domain-containing protein n=1 Tax=Trinickia terrae TaxID=2571161 RepID=A0A4V5PIU5_9BURK|nr:YjgN family protein [Trinickia terrae]TKC85880.1 DUF898 domain-containing protein [Trinickia terrae]
MNSNSEQRPLLQYDGKIGEIYGIFLKNLLLTLITFGIYRFWAISRMRRYVWSRMQFQGNRFEYTGKGGELFKGYLLAIGAFVGIFVVAVVLSAILQRVTGSRALGGLPIFAAYLFLVVVGMGAHFSAQRYRLSRTLWCGIRGGMSGSALRYGVMALLYGLLCVVTLGQMTPWTMMRLAERRINASSFGSERFHFEGRAGQLYLAFVGTFIAVIVLFGVLLAIFIKSLGALFTSELANGAGRHALSGHAVVALIAFYFLFLVGALLIQCFYAALVARHVTGNTTLGTQLRFASRVTGPRLLGLMLGNLALVFCTLGLAYPIALHRALRFTAEMVRVEGSIDPQALAQSSERMPRTGEGMLNLLDHGSML